MEKIYNKYLDMRIACFMYNCRKYSIEVKKKKDKLLENSKEV